MKIIKISTLNEEKIQRKVFEVEEYIKPALKDFAAQNKDVVINFPRNEWGIHSGKFGVFFEDWLKNKPVAEDRKKIMVKKMMTPTPFGKKGYYRMDKKSFALNRKLKRTEFVSGLSQETGISEPSISAFLKESHHSNIKELILFWDEAKNSTLTHKEIIDEGVKVLLDGRRRIANKKRKEAELADQKSFVNDAINASGLEYDEFKNYPNLEGGYSNRDAVSTWNLLMGEYSRENISYEEKVKNGSEILKRKGNLVEFTKRLEDLTGIREDTIRTYILIPERSGKDQRDIWNNVNEIWADEDLYFSEKIEIALEFIKGANYSQRNTRKEDSERMEKIYSILEDIKNGVSTPKTFLEMSEMANYSHLQSIYKLVSRWWKRNAPSDADGRTYKQYYGFSQNNLSSVHSDGGESRSMHEVVIRDLFFFIGVNFKYEPTEWISLPFVQKFAEECFSEAIEYNNKKEAEGQELDPNYELTEKPYETTYPQPDFLLEGKILYEVFGGSMEQDRYDYRAGFKKEMFKKYFKDNFAFIDQNALIKASNKRSLVSYAKALDDSSCSASGCGPDVLGYQVLNRMQELTPLLKKENITLNANYCDQLARIGDLPELKPRLENELIPKWDEWEFQQHEEENSIANSNSWYKVSQANDRTKPVSFNEMVVALKQEGFLTPHMWSDIDKVAVYFKTPENLNQALQTLNQREVIEFPQQEQQVAAFNLSRMKK
jgi:hypothetical protein